MSDQSKNNKASKKPDAFEAWIAERHKWLQTAARYLIDTKQSPDNKELVALGDLCIVEATGGKSQSFLAVEPGSLALDSAQPKLDIVAVNEVRGVNAIKNGASLPFGQANITVIYGANGSGKTGFSRLLKHACGSRSKETELLPNIFEEKNPPATAKVIVGIGGTQKELQWAHSGGALPELRHVHVFDWKTASMYVGGHNEATYEPSRMRFVAALIAICDRLAAHFEKEKIKLVKKLPLVPPELSATKSIQWLSTLKASTTADETDRACSFPKPLDEERVSIETALGQKDIGGRLQAISRDRAALSQVKITLVSWKEMLSDERLHKLIAARVDAFTKRKAASEDAKKVFGAAPLKGVGEDSWQLLWDQARAFSELHAYVGAPFPKTDDGSRCVLCQQILEPEGRQRLDHFEAFVRGGLEESAKQAEKLLEVLSAHLPQIPEPKEWVVQATLLKIDDQDATQFLIDIAARKTLRKLQPKKKNCLRLIGRKWKSMQINLQVA